jgi:hypothetical protein
MVASSRTVPAKSSLVSVMMKVPVEPGLRLSALWLALILKFPTLRKIWSEWEMPPAVAVTVTTKSWLGVRAVVDIVRIEVPALLSFKITVVVLSVTVGPLVPAGLTVTVRVTVPAKPMLFSTTVEFWDAPAFSINDSGFASIVKSPAGGDMTLTETVTL